MRAYLTTDFRKRKLTIRLQKLESREHARESIGTQLQQEVIRICRKLLILKNTFLETMLGLELLKG